MSGAGRKARGWMAARTAAGDARGFALLGVLIVVAAMGATLAAGGTLWHQLQLREKERELLFIGQQFRTAIRRYYEAVPARPSYPPNLEALLLDARLPSVQRYLRRIYRDPLSGSAEWGLVPAPGGGIMGVYSLATGTPVRTAGFPAGLGWTGSPQGYAEWKFIHVPPVGGGGRSR